MKKDNSHFDFSKSVRVIKLPEFTEKEIRDTEDVNSFSKPQGWLRSRELCKIFGYKGSRMRYILQDLFEDNKIERKIFNDNVNGVNVKAICYNLEEIKKFIKRRN